MAGWPSAAQDRLPADVPRARHGRPGVPRRPLAVGARRTGRVHSTRRPGSGPLARRCHRRTGTWGDQPVCPQLPWQVPDQRGHDGSVGPVEPGVRAWCGAARRPRAGAPAAPRSWTLTSGRAGPASRRAGRRPDRAGGGTRLTIMPHGRTPPIAAGHRNRPNFGTRQGHVRSGRCLPAYLLVVALSSVDVPVAMTAPHADPTRARRELSGRGRGCWAPGCLTARATGWPRR
jgi:hypothetical protein